MNRQLLFVLFGAAALGGCTLLPSQDAETPVAVAGPDPTAPRLEPLDTRFFPVLDESTVVGEPQILFARHEDTLPDIARAHNLGLDELKAANPGVDTWLPGEGTPVLLPTRFVLPSGARDGIVLNVANMRLYYFLGEDLVTHPMGIGREEWATPTGEAKVIDKVRDPAWYVPASIRKEHAEMGDPLPAVVPPGPDNPLGRFALKLDLPGYLIHGTNQPFGVGMRVSHGCIRLYPEDIAEVFDAVPIGTAVRIIDNPIMAGWHGDQLLVEAHPSLAEDERDRMTLARAAVEAEMQRVGQPLSTIDFERLAEVVQDARGIPLPVSRFSETSEQFLADARLIVNRVPIAVAESGELVPEG